MRLNFGWSVELGLNLALETQRKGNSANKASRSSSDKSACVSWFATETTILTRGARVHIVCVQKFHTVPI